MKDVEGLWKNTGELDIHFGMLVLSHAITEHLKNPLNKQKLQFNKRLFLFKSLLT